MGAGRGLRGCTNWRGIEAGNGGKDAETKTNRPTPAAAASCSAHLLGLKIPDKRRRSEAWLTSATTTFASPLMRRISE